MDQDWKPVILRKDPPVAKQISTGKLTKDIVEKKDACKNKQTSTGAIDPRKLEENEVGELPTPSTDVAKQIVTARTAKGWTQKELDQKCNLPPGTVQKYENRTALYHQDEINKMSRALGVTIKKNVKK